MALNVWILSEVRDITAFPTSHGNRDQQPRGDFDSPHRPRGPWLTRLLYLLCVYCAPTPNLRIGMCLLPISLAEPTGPDAKELNVF